MAAQASEVANAVEEGVVPEAVGIRVKAAGMAGVGAPELRKARGGTGVSADQETVAPLVTRAERVARGAMAVPADQEIVAPLVARVARAVSPQTCLGREERAVVEAMRGCPGLVTAERDAVVARAAAGVLGSGCPAMELMVGAASAPPAMRSWLLLHLQP